MDQHLLKEALKQLGPSDSDREAWRESSERAGRLDGHCRPRGNEPEPRRSRPEQYVGGQTDPQSLPTPPGAGITVPTTLESLPPLPTTPQSMPPVPVSSGSSLASSGTGVLSSYARGPLDSASQNVSLHEQGAEEDVNFVLCGEESAQAEVHVLLAGGRKEIDAKDAFWKYAQGSGAVGRKCEEGS